MSNNNGICISNKLKQEVDLSRICSLDTNSFWFRARYYISFHDNGHTSWWSREEQSEDVCIIYITNKIDKEKDLYILCQEIVKQKPRKI